MVHVTSAPVVRPGRDLGRDLLAPASSSVTSTSAAPRLSTEDLRVPFRTFNRILHAMNDVLYTIDACNALTIVCESGSIKTVTSLTTLGLTRTKGARVE